MPIDSTKLQLLSKAMQTYTMRMQAHAGNLANLDTPGYQRVAVSFEEQLQGAIHSAGADLDAVTPRMEVQPEAPALEDELMELADTQMRTQFSTRALRDYFDALRTGITGRIS